ncbi:MAG: hypothetical protein IT324_13905 [Anaerolineae bacterium]|nr:hypothetical protein [Anaerolineae bacterium]
MRTPFKSVVLLMLLVCVAIPHSAAQSQDGTPAATRSACIPAPVPAGPASDANVRQQVTLDKMRGHLLVSLMLWQTGAYDLASQHASHPTSELITIIRGDLRQVCLLDDTISVLAGYVALAGKAGDKTVTQQAHAAALAILDRASAALIPAEAQPDPAFNLRVIAALLTDAQQEYAEAYKDGKIVEAIEYQDSMGFHLAAKARYVMIQPMVTQQYPDLDKQMTALWASLAELYPDVKPPAQATDPAKLATANQDLSAAITKTFNITLDTKLSPVEYLTNTQHTLMAALELYEKGQADDAYEEAASAYLDQFENAEAALSAKDKALMETIEVQMKDFRDAIKAQKPLAEVQAILDKINPNLDKAITLLS